MISETENLGGELKRENGGASRSSAPPFSGKPKKPYGGLTREKYLELRAIGENPLIDFEITLLTIFRETERYLDKLERAVSEGRAIDEANNFARWLEFSGVIRLLEKYAFIDERYATLRQRMIQVREWCIPYLLGLRVRLPPSQARVDELNDKVDVLLSIFAKKALPSTSEPLQITDVGDAIRCALDTP